MKKRKSILIISAIALIFGSLLFVKCKQIGDPTDGLKLIINYNVIKTSLSVSFLDAATGEPIGYSDDNNVNVHLTGKDAHMMLDITGAVKTTFQAARGFLGFGLDPSFTPSETDPIEFTIVAERNGYATTSKPIRIGIESNQAIIINMVDLNNLPTGVTNVSNFDIMVTDSVVDADVVIETPAAGTTGTKAQLTVKQGTRIIDANGNTLTGNFSANIIYYNNMDDQSLAAFPGGLTASIDNNGTTENGMFYSGGFASIEIVDANGINGTSFQYNELELVIEMSNNTYNRNTAAHIEDQDTVPLWSYDLESGYWKLDEWTLIEDNGGVMQTTTGLSHLTFFNLDWWWPYYGNSFVGAMLRFFYLSKDASAGAEKVALEITVKKKADNTYINRYLIQAPIGEEFPIGGWGLGDEAVVLEIRSLCDAGNVQIYEVADPSQGVYDITLQNVQSTGVTVSVNFEGWCLNNPDVIIRPSMPFVYRELCSGEQWVWSYMVEGFASLDNLKVGSTYSVGVYYDGELFEADVLLDDPNQSYSIEFTPEVCNIIGQ